VFFASMEDDLITQYAPDAAPPDEVDDDGLVTDAGAYWMLGHAQRVAEGVNLEIHRNTWRYNKLIEEQRGIVLDYREKVLRTDLALKTLGERCPERLKELSETLDDDVLAEAARQITLYHLDRGWADHIADLADVREGIHLRALGRGLDPLDEFHKAAVASFNKLFDEAAQRSATGCRVPRLPQRRTCSFRCRSLLWLRRYGTFSSRLLARSPARPKADFPGSDRCVGTRRGQKSMRRALGGRHPSFSNRLRRRLGARN
jgi:preprotein translocase subunit SecA